MLWILLLTGCVGAVIMLIWTIVDMVELDWYEAGRVAIRLGIFVVVGAVGFFGLAGIDSMSYEEVSQTGDFNLQSLSDSSQISGKGTGGLFYAYVSMDTNEVYSFYYQVDDDGY